MTPLFLALLGALPPGPPSPGPARSAELTEDPAPNDPALCPYCDGDPGIMQRAGVVSHGGFGFGTSDTREIDRLLPDVEIRWIETEHFEIGLGIGAERVGTAERRAVRAELERLQERLPEVEPKTRLLDPWLRLHLYAQRMEELYQLFLEILAVPQESFPSGEQPWVVGTPYFGEGPHLGQKGKYEILVLPNGGTQVAFLRSQFGLGTRLTQKWNAVDQDTLMVVTNLLENDLTNDTALHNHLVFNTAHNLLDGYKHYSYDTPFWLKEGVAHWAERRLNPDYNSFSYSEGGLAESVYTSDWDSDVKKLLQQGDAPRLAELVNLQTFAGFTTEDHLVSWSMVKFLIEEHPEAFACINARLHGRKDERGYADQSRLLDVQRDAFRDCLGMSYARFDEAWKTWAMSR